MENLLFLGVPILKHIRVVACPCVLGMYMCVYYQNSVWAVTLSCMLGFENDHRDKTECRVLELCH